MNRALVLFDIDGTLMRRAGPHHRRALEMAVEAVTGRAASTESIPVAGMLDRDILVLMMQAAGMTIRSAKLALPAIVDRAQRLYGRGCPDLRRRVCPGVRTLLRKLRERDTATGLVTGNLSRIGWKKMERSGLREYFQFGAFAEMGRTRGELARIAKQQAIRSGRISRHAPALLIGDHPNDIAAARESGLVSIAVATGIVPRAELARHSPDILLDDLREFDMEWLTGPATTENARTVLRVR